MKTANYLKNIMFISTLFILNSCTVIGGIFKAGVWTGIFIVAAGLIAANLLNDATNKFSEVSEARSED